MQKTRTALKLILASLLSCLALCGASPSAQGAQQLQQCDLADASSLLQQHATATGVSHLPASSTASAWSNASLMASFKELEKEAETYKLEDALRLYKTGQRLANLSHLSPEEKGLMLLQEARRISNKDSDDPSPFDPLWEALRKFKEWTGKSQAFACYGSNVQFPFNLLGAIFSIFVSVRCNSVGSCTSEGIESVRYLLVAMQHWKGRKSYCADTFKMDYLCKAAKHEVGSNVAGLSSAIAGLTYKCPEYAGSSDKKVVGLKVTNIQCYLGYAKGAGYLALAISKISEIYFGWSENTANKEVSQTQGRAAITFYTGTPYSSFFSQLGATLAWIAQIVLLMMGNCKGEAGKTACGGEIAKLVAYVSQSVTGGFNWNSYCYDPDNRKEVMEMATDTRHFGHQDSVDDLRKMGSLPLTVQKTSPTAFKSKKLTKALSMPIQGVDDSGSNEDEAAAAD